MNVVIVCGGLSTRLGDITKHVPKILLDIGGRTVLDWQLAMLRPLGVSRVVLAAGHLSDVLQKQVGTSYKGFDIVYAVEEKKLGTGGAIKNAFSYIDTLDEPTLILNGDVLSTVNFGDMVNQLRHGSDGLILGTKVDDASTYGTLAYDETHHLLSFKEKEGKQIEGYINGGVYLFTTQATAYFPDEDAFSIEYDVFPHMKELYVYLSDSPWIDVGVPERLAWAREHADVFSSVVL
ncbi:MAG: NTP transferase domain-containing protein [Candidatus Magasanikbacteria bacterium]|nr:NTP transferase domain-containing protein [Candidatus Magasanikbacteria bacterium]NCS72350.1 NTP transferase domain-containing protein [Candidatus Magasanikbacteria bacterium]